MCAEIGMSVSDCRRPKSTGRPRLSGFVSRFMVLVQALPVIHEHADNPAISDLAALALTDHAPEFGLQRLKARDTTFHLFKLAPGDVVGGIARAIRIIC